MNERFIELANKANETVGYTFRLEDAKQLHELMEKFAELVWKAAYEEGHDVGVDAGFEAGYNAGFTEQNFGVEE